MGWFDEQIRQRKKSDNEMFESSFVDLAGAVLGKRPADSGELTKSAIEDILKFYRVKMRDIPGSIKDVDGQLEYLLRPSGVMRRTVILEKGWRKDAFGAMLATRKDNGEAVALIPGKAGGYVYYDSKAGKRRRVTGEAEKLFGEEAIAFYRSFPQKKLDIPALIRYVIETFTLSDFVSIGAAVLLMTLVGMLTPKLNSLLFSTVVENGSVRLLLALSIFSVCVSVSALMFTVVRTLLEQRLNTKLSLSTEAATMARVMSLPPEFFKKYSSGELSSRAQNIPTLCNVLVSAVLSTGLTSAFSLIYITQIFTYAPALVVPALGVIAATVLVSLATTLAQTNINRRLMEHGAKGNGLSYALITGVQKIKLAGAEKRAYSKWSRHFADELRLTYSTPMLLRLSPVINLGVSLTGTLIMYWAAIKSGVSVADYYAFNTAYGMVSGAFVSLSSLATSFAQIKPVLEMAAPIMEAEPETAANKQIVTGLNGGIELSHVSFRYSENMPLVIDDLSLKIRPGQYVAIVGKTGCGKSTLMRLLLGFEKPQKGSIFYDGREISTLDLRSLRGNIGSVMQNGKLFLGDIYSNIIISAPQTTIDDAWKAAELAGIAEDIRHMPMGMYTMISEGSGGISGGQRQRLMIARAIAPKPKILMFDEATSALDNVTQKKVSESLDSLKCTRIVIAHRLSTIKHCDRILVFDGGKIVEDGTYDELIANGGFFADLVSRQRLDTAEN